MEDCDCNNGIFISVKFLKHAHILIALTHVGSTLVTIYSTIQAATMALQAIHAATVALQAIHVATVLLYIYVSNKVV